MVNLLPPCRHLSSAIISLIRHSNHTAALHTSPSPTPNNHDLPRSQTKAKETKAHFFRNAKSTSFLDVMTLSATAGSGGDGCVAFARTKFVPYGPPSGGSGGPGGSIFIRAVPTLRSLAKVPPRVQAGQGGMGKGNWMNGRPGKDVTLQVPVGTVVKVWRSSLEGEAAGASAMAQRREAYEAQLLSRLGRGGKFKRIVRGEEDVDDDPEAQGKEARRVQRNFAQEEEEAFEEHQMISSVWRHYPGQGGAAEGLGADVEDEQELYARDDFSLAEERYAIALRKERLQHRRKQNEDIEAGTDQSSAHPLLTLDLSAPTPPSSPGHLVASGGSPGFGNPFFLVGGNRSPKFATRGRQGECVSITLELKSPADIGFIGLPNAGKSSLLRALTGATKKSAQVGGWEFTTLTPNVGILRVDSDREGKRRLIGTGTEPIFDSTVEDLPLADDGEQQPSSITPSQDQNIDEAQYVLSDLPGLIKGASLNRGLGHQFLRHAERCLALIFVVDVSASRPEPWEDLLILKHELEGYQSGLSNKIRAVVANKCDALGPTPERDASSSEARLTEVEAREKLRFLQQRVSEDHGRHLPIYPVSAMWRQGVDRLASSIEKLILQEKAKEEERSKHNEEVRV